MRVTEDSVVNPQVRIRNMSNNESPRRKQARADHDCVEDIAALTERFLSYLAKCRKDCSPEHAWLLVLEMACAALRFIRIADGPDTARDALVAIREIMEVETKFDGTENGTRH